MLKFYNTLTRKKEEFIPLEEGKVSLYSCGPTVYNYVHIGNLRSYIFVDLLKRYLIYKQFKVKHVMNITDVDDKTIRDSKKAKKSLKEFTEFYTKAFLDDTTALKILPPEKMPKATESIEDMVGLIKLLLEKGFAYKTEKGDIYFRIANFKDYGKLAKIDAENLKKNADGRMNADEYEKDDARDFALWKSYDKEDGDVFWNTEIGKGRPGWHIECSAMSKKTLGQPFDIHAGGVDLIFPHHTNEIAQSECAYGKKFVNYWIHNEHLLVNGQKMSKSLGNFYTLNDLLKKGYTTESIRYELLKTHYRAKLDFREEELAQIPNTLQKFYDFLEKISKAEGKGEKIDNILKKAEKEFENAMDDDLNISKALAVIFEFMTEINKLENLSKENAERIKELMLRFDSVLGVMQKEKEEIPKEVMKIVNEREKARKERNWALSDKLRDEIQKKGYFVEDSKQGTVVKKSI